MKTLNKKETRLIGQCQFTGNLIATDPCYDRNVTYSAWNVKIDPGVYDCYLVYTDEGDWGKRVAEILILKPFYLLNELTEKLSLDHIGVDSGQAGFFNNEDYPLGKTGDSGDKKSFYGECCNTTLGEGYYYSSEVGQMERLLESAKQRENQDIIDFYKQELDELLKNPIEYLQGGILTDNKGFLSSSGFGDGGYSLYLYEDQNGVNHGAKIVFIGNEDEEND